MNEQHQLRRFSASALCFAGTDQDSPPAARQVCSVLLVEGNPLAQRVTKLTLEEGGYQVAIAETGADAVAQLQRDMPDLVLHNLDLPGMSRCDLRRLLTLLPEWAGVPVLTYSTNVEQLQVLRGIDRGASGVLVKPFMPSHLLQNIAFYLGWKAQACRGAVVRSRSFHGTRRPDGQQPGKGREILLVDDNAFQRRWLAGHLARLGFEVMGAGDSVEALDRSERCAADAIVCKALLPGCDGFELCLSLRQHTRTANIPVVLIHHGRLEAVDRGVARSVGANDLVPCAPHDGDAVVDALVRSLMERSVGQRPSAVVFDVA